MTRFWITTPNQKIHDDGHTKRLAGFCAEADFPDVRAFTEALNAGQLVPIRRVQMLGYGAARQVRYQDEAIGRAGVAALTVYVPRRHDPGAG